MLRQQLRLRSNREAIPNQQGVKMPLLAAPSLTDLTPGVWNVDASHSTVGFVARHLMVSKVRGRFGTFSGTLTIGEDPLASKVEPTAETASITTRDDGRDTHLKSGDFF